MLMPAIAGTAPTLVPTGCDRLPLRNVLASGTLTRRTSLMSSNMRSDRIPLQMERHDMTGASTVARRKVSRKWYIHRREACLERFSSVRCLRVWCPPTTGILNASA
jgi:hypothetical protein